MPTPINNKIDVFGVLPIFIYCSLHCSQKQVTGPYLEPLTEHTLKLYEDLF